MSTEPIIILMIVGAIGGLVRAILGFQMQSPPNEKFHWVKLVKTIIRSAVGGAFIVYNMVDVSEPTTKLYIGAFFTSVGADVVMKEIYGTTKKVKNSIVK